MKNLKFYIHFLACFFALNQVFAQPKQLIFKDEFKDNRNKWWTGKNESGSCNIVDDKYIIEYKKDKSWTTKVDCELIQDEDFVIETNIAKIAGTNENGYGITWGKGSSGYYTFIITGSGKFYVRKVEKDSPGQYLINWSKSNAIKKDLSANKLRVQKMKNKVSFFVNDQFLGDITFQRFYGNQFGITVYENQKVEVLDFMIYGTPTETKKEVLKFPDLQIQQFAINDGTNEQGEQLGNGNFKVEPGESVEVIAFVQNFGFGNAADVTAEVFLNINNQNVNYPDDGRVYKLNEIISGDYKKLEFYFYTSSRFTLSKIPFTIKLTDTKTNFSSDIPLVVELKKTLPSINEITIAKLDVKKQTVIKNINEVVQPSDVDKDIPRSKNNGANTLVVIFGIEDYKYAPKVDFAKRDAQTFYNYAVTLFGVPEKNIFLRTNSEATLGEFQKIFAEDGWLERRIKPEITDIIIYYAGHGAPDTKTSSAFLIPYDIDPNYAKTGYSLDKMYQSLSLLNAKSITVYIDACFSGMSRSAEMLIDGSRTVRIKPLKAAITGKNMNVFSACSADQYSAAFPDKGHGLFSYFLFKGLKGEAKGKGKSLTVDMLQKYLEKNILIQATALDKEQTPMLEGTNNQQLIIEY